MLVNLIREQALEECRERQLGNLPTRPQIGLATLGCLGPRLDWNFPFYKQEREFCSLASTEAIGHTGVWA